MTKCLVTLVHSRVRREPELCAALPGMASP